MKNISNTLKNAIELGEICTLFSITAKTGTALHFTDTNNPITVNGITYISNAGVGRLKMKITNNAEVSNQEFAATVLDLPEDELKSGKWDSAKIEVSITSWRNPDAGKLIIFKGGIGVIQWTDEGFRADIQNYLRDLGKNIGSTVTGNCRHQLFNTAGAGKIGYCGVNRENFKSTATINYILTPKLKFKVNTTGKSSDWATYGFVKFTSGINSGLSYEIKKHLSEGGNLGESFELFLPTIGTIAIGDTIEFTAGCDHTMDACKNKFNNVVNFGGFPHIQVDTNLKIENA